MQERRCESCRCAPEVADSVAGVEVRMALNARIRA